VNKLDEETGFIVIGSGGSGLAAAVTVAEEGVNAMVFEKQPSLGGSSNFFAEIFAVESEMQKKQYIASNRD
jgi:fumarate reductase flavoprotein subunit